MNFWNHSTHLATPNAHVNITYDVISLTRRYHWFHIEYRALDRIPPFCRESIELVKSLWTILGRIFDRGGSLVHQPSGEVGKERTLEDSLMFLLIDVICRNLSMLAGRLQRRTRLTMETFLLHSVGTSSSMTALLDPPRTLPANSVTLFLQLGFGLGEGFTVSKLTITGDFYNISWNMRLTHYIGCASLDKSQVWDCRHCLSALIRVLIRYPGWNEHWLKYTS